MKTKSKNKFVLREVNILKNAIEFIYLQNKL